MKKMKLWIAGLLFAVFGVAGGAGATTVSDDMVFEGPVTIGGTLFPSADGTATYQLTTDGAGALTWGAAGGSAAWDDLTVPDNNESLDMTTFTTTWDFGGVADMFTLEFTGNFGNVSGMKLEQKTGDPTDGTLFELIVADTNVDALTIYNSTTELTVANTLMTLDFKDNDDSDGTFILARDNSSADTVFKVASGGDVTISETTTIDENSLDFAGGAGSITVAASSALTLNPADGDASGEDLIITAHNVQLTAAGKLTMSPDAGETLAIDLTHTNYTNAISLGANAIIGSTPVINLEDFDLSADGLIVIAPDGGSGTGIDIDLDAAALDIGIDLSDSDIVAAIDIGANTIISTGGTFAVASNGDVTANDIGCEDLTVAGTFIGTVIGQDSIVAITPDTSLTLDGLGTGGVSVGTASGTGDIILGGSATEVTLPSTVDLTMEGGDVSVTDTANSDLVTLVNDTLTTADILDISAGGTRTSGNVIKIADSSTLADTISITADAQTSGDGIFYSNDGAGLTGSVIHMDVTDGVGFTGYYIRAYDGGADDFSVKRYGATTIGGLASTDMLTVTAGDIEITTGDIDLNDGIIAVNNDADESNNITRNFDGAGGAAVLVVSDDHISSTNIALDVNQDGTAGSTAVRIVHDGDGEFLNLDAGAARTGDVINIDMANQLAEKAIDIGTADAWTGTAGEGMIDLHSTGDIAATASLLRLAADTGQPDDGSGWCLNVDDDSLVVATPSHYAVLIDSNANEALHVATGKALFDEQATFTLGLGVTGTASTDMITVTTGDVQVDDGKLEINTDEDDTSSVERAQATVNGPVFSVIEQTASAGGCAFFVDQDSTVAASEAIHIDTEGGLGIYFDPLATTGDGIKFDVADSYAGQGIVADLGPWLGAAGEGFIDITSDGGAVAEAGQAISITLQGTTAPGTAVDGHGLYILSEADYKAGQSLVHLDNENNIALEIFNSGTTGDGIKFDVINAYAGQGIIADLGPWVGTAGQGFIDIDSDGGAVAEAGHAIHITLGGTTADVAAISGKGLYIKDAAGATANSYLIHAESDYNGAAYLDGDIDVKFSNNDDFLSIGANAADYAAGSGIVSVYDDSTGQASLSYLYRGSREADGDEHDGFIIFEDASTGIAANGAAKFSIVAGGTTTWTLDAASLVTIDANATANTGTVGVLALNVQSATNTAKGSALTFQLEDGATLAYGHYVDVDDDTTGAEVIDCYHAVNSAGTNATTKGFVAAATIDQGFAMTNHAAAQSIVLDATTTASTSTTGGLLDVAFRTATDGAQAINIDVESDVAGGAGEVVEGIHIQLDDDANTADDVLVGIEFDTDENGTGLQHAMIVRDSAGWDAGLWLEGGYLRVGDGGTPGQALGDGDNGYFEGTVEIDGNLYPDGNIIGDNSTAVSGVASVSYGAHASVIYYANVELTNGNIKALRTTKKELIATPGANKFIEVVSAVLILDKGTEGLTESEDNLVIEYATSGDDITAAIEMTGFIDQVADTIMVVAPSNPLAANASADMVNNAVQLFNTGDGEIAGNTTADATMTVKIAYRVHSDGL